MASTRTLPENFASLARHVLVRSAIPSKAEAEGLVGDSLPDIESLWDRIGEGG